MNNLTKQDLRERILTLLRNQEEEERLTKSLSVKDKLFNMDDFQKANTVLFYASFDGEVDTFEMIKQAIQSGKSVALPRIESAQKRMVPTLWEQNDPLEDGPYGIKQPKEKGSSRLTQDALDAIIVPGVAFDRNRHRLGRGGGYYDRFLAAAPKEVPTFGLAFDFQCVDVIPELSDHDVALSYVVTN